ncbi:MAG TPA: GTPase domain-containing protein [Thermoanaerobaculia bacterium]|nr:GTPase domain-containing protein [Thermoanaerobaculia bacterium]
MRYFFDMVLFNHATREITAKIVYYGPGLCGKTTNLLVIFDKLDPDTKGKMLSLATKSDRTLFFDLLPVDIGKIGNFNLRLQLYTVPGQVFYNETRKLVLKGADAVVFVADSQPSMLQSNRESFANLLENLEENQIDANDIPIVIQYNKRDIPGVLPVEELEQQLGLDGYPFIEAAALQGDGVMETFKLVTKISAKHLIAKLQGRPPKPSKRQEKKGEGRKSAPKAPSTVPDAIDEAAPFPEASPLDAGYEKMEEVSLEQLLEGRDRPATMSGNIPIPPLPIEEDVEELGSHEMIATPLSEVEVPFLEPEIPEVTPSFLTPDSSETPFLEPIPSASGNGRIVELEAEVDALRSELHQLREQHDTLRLDVAKRLEELIQLVRPS